MKHWLFILGLPVTLIVGLFTAVSNASALPIQQEDDCSFTYDFGEGLQGWAAPGYSAVGNQMVYSGTGGSTTLTGAELATDMGYTNYLITFDSTYFRVPLPVSGGSGVITFTGNITSPLPGMTPYMSWTDGGSPGDWRFLAFTIHSPAGVITYGEPYLESFPCSGLEFDGQILPAIEPPFTFTLPGPIDLEPITDTIDYTPLWDFDTFLTMTSIIQTFFYLENIAPFLKIFFFVMATLAGLRLLIGIVSGRMANKRAENSERV